MHAGGRRRIVPGDGVHDGDEQAHHAEAGSGLEGVGGVVDVRDWPQAWVGQNSVTGFRHESGSASAIPGRTSRTAIMAGDGGGWVPEQGPRGDAEHRPGSRVPAPLPPPPGQPRPRRAPRGGHGR